MSRVTALSNAKDGIPARASLRHFWLEVEEAITTLSPAIPTLTAFSPAAIRRLAPFLLGAPLWAQVKGRIFGDWQDFRDMVDLEVGMTAEEERCAFYSMLPSGTEADEDFVLRVEAQR
jgi:hypothetical protein